ncbi:SDR family oxidoreductase [Halovivax limisalsi]|uniref:SDR family oxidoreductase n=1 Tax=Halovivax limisalsi TaxID=1453760 RepID=UPI001FFD0B89|nr:SDR family oxidoreductase [Halovivax limisalsi]
MRVGILGCGYVGLELGRQLLERGDEVWGVRRSADGLDRVEAAGIRPVRADVTDRSTLEAVPDVDALVYAVSSGGRDAAAARERYVEGLETVLAAVGARPDPPDRLVYTSSTGVYGDHDGDWVDESTPIRPATERASVLANAEEIVLNAGDRWGINGTVARLAGIYGPGRYRIDRYLDGPVLDGYRNTIHRDDAAGAVAHLLATDAARDEVVLVVDDEPVSRWAFADWLAERCGRPSPPKETVADRLAGDDRSERARRRVRTNKRCSNDRLVSLGYTYRYPTYREGYRGVVDDTA